MLRDPVWKERALLVLFLSFFAPTSGIAVSGEAPVISGLSVSPDAGPAGTSYRLSLRLEDPQGLDDVPKTLYQVREGIEPIELQINDRGMQGDLKAGDGIFSGQSRVPATAAKRRHRFEVFVRDQSGHQSNLLVYHFTVLEGIQI